MHALNDASRLSSCDMPDWWRLGRLVEYTSSPLPWSSLRKDRSKFGHKSSGGVHHTAVHTHKSVLSFGWHTGAVVATFSRSRRARPRPNQRTRNKQRASSSHAHDVTASPASKVYDICFHFLLPDWFSGRTYATRSRWPIKLSQHGHNNTVHNHEHLPSSEHIRATTNADLPKKKSP